METYPVDIDPEQVVRWIRAEQELAPGAFVITARRTTEVREIPLRKETHLGDEEREDLSEVAVIGTLEIAPVHAADGWLLTVIVENEAGPRLPDAAPAIEPEQEIDLGTFYREFIEPGAGTAYAFAGAESPEAEARLAELLDRIEGNYHGPGDRRPSAADASTRRA